MGIDLRVVLLRKQQLLWVLDLLDQVVHLCLLFRPRAMIFFGFAKHAVSGVGIGIYFLDNDETRKRYPLYVLKVITLSLKLNNTDRVVLKPKDILKPNQHHSTAPRGIEQSVFIR